VTLILTEMAPRSRTGKLMQGLFGRFGKQQPEQSPVPKIDFRQNRQSSSPTDKFADFDDRDWDNPVTGDSPEERLRQRDFPIVSQFDNDDEETNWDDAEASDNENNPLVPRIDRRDGYAQPTITVVDAPNVANLNDLDDWAEALPAATVKNSNIQESRRGKNFIPFPPNEDIWEDNPRNTQDRSAVTATGRSVESDTATQVNRFVGFWTATLQQFRRILPAPLRQLSDAILTAIIVVLLVTVTIWAVDGFFMPGIERAAPSPPAATVAAQPAMPTPIDSPAIVSPEQVFIEALETQISEITSQYPDDLVQTLNVDTASDRLLVRLNPVWYTLNDDRQNSLTDRMWLQAQSNHFTKLEIQDSQGVSIARSPVVGKHPIILQRRQS
jgi:hypothetical protein